MTRTVLAASAALLTAGMLMSTAAEACISCEYVPEVVRHHATSPLAYGRGDGGVSHGAAVGYSVKKRIAKSEYAPKPKKVAKIERLEKPAKLAKVSKPDAAEPVTVAKSEPVEKKAATNNADSESSSITVAAAEVAKVAKDAAAAVTGKPTDCKKFFASVGMTLTVPCE
ncbi:MAG: hypothetical protein ACK4TP_14040 [Hyphomicrobium sp.]